MSRIVGISGSLRSGSYNTALLHAAAAEAPEGTELTVETLHGIPLYDADLEADEGIPPRVSELKDAMAEADGLLLATPEYNNSMPGVLKNGVDWLTRPPSDIGKVFRGKPVAVMGATPGRAGTVLAQNAWLPVLRTLGTRPWFGSRLLVSGAGDVFDDDGALVDEEIREKLRKFVRGFVDFVS